MAPVRRRTMDCPPRENLEALFDGEVTGDEKVALEGHIPSCGTCTAVMDEIRAIWDALDAYPEPEIPALDARGVIARATRRQRHITILKVGYGVAAAVLLVVTLWGVGLLDPAEDIVPPVKPDLVANWDIIHDLDFLQEMEEGDLELLENLELLEAIPLELMNGSENG